ncbi:hypothetical protein GALMADRAFT_136300 [Galerina marginata CBS 339.88]|uniref:Uncharacterized protein n=1 Tax=Galerina marginata (strain CBS 339.88) TaxID=685588 RepID=A0A067TDN3_GALM3|nr:hypothetical protein GALMADRAFT_136300 [Galerina marginata CBS 339.88]
MNPQTFSNTPSTDITWFLEHPASFSNYIVKEEVTSTNDTRLFSQAALTSSAVRRQCLIFSTGGSMDYIYFAPINNDPHMLDVSRVFPNGAVSVRIACFPGTSLKLDSDWRIIVSKGLPNAPLNLALKSLFNKDWYGNLVITKYDDSGNLEDLHPKDKDAAVPILKMWLDNFDNVRSSIQQRF